MAFTLSGLSAAYGAGTPTRAFTVAMVGGNPGSTVTMALDDGSAGGTFFPSTLTFLTTGATSKQFVYIPPISATANITVTATASGGMTGSHSLVLPAGTATQVSKDTFGGSSGTNLTGHTMDSGGSWAAPYTSASTQVLTGSNAARMNGSDPIVPYEGSDSIASNAECDCAILAKVFDLSTKGQLGVILRGGASSSNLKMYDFGFFTAALGWYLQCYNNDGGVNLITLGSFTTPQPTTGGEIRLAIRFIDSAQWLFPIYNGALITTPVQDSVLTSGKAGMLAILQAGTPDNTGGQQASQYLVQLADWNAPAATFTFPDSNMFQSPANWRNSGGSAITTIGGAYILTKFSGSTSVKLNVNTAGNAGLSADDMPAFRVIIDDLPEVFVQIPVSGTQVTLATGLSTGTHKLRIDCIGGAQTAGDSWTTALGWTVIDSLQLDNGATLSAPTLRSKRILIFGDSYLAYFGNGISGPVYDWFNPTRSWAPQVAYAFGAEYCEEPVDACGWVQDAASQSQFPAFPDWFAFYDDANARTFSGIDACVAAFGINDGLQSDAAVTAAVTAWIADARSKLGSAAIFVVIPFNGEKRSAITAGVTAAADANTYLIDLGTELESAISFPGSMDPTWLCDDGSHVAQRWEGLFGSKIAKLMQEALGGGSGSGPVAFAF